MASPAARPMLSDREPFATSSMTTPPRRCAARGAAADPFRLFRRQRRRHRTDPCAVHLSVAQQVLDDLARAVDGNGEADALRIRINSSIYPDYFPFYI